jgi:hypothetical protein
MSSDIVERLLVGPEYREDKVDGGIAIWPTLTRAEIAEIMLESAARIEALQADLAKAREALEPFATVGKVIDGPFGPALFADDDQAFQSGCAWKEDGETKTLTWGQFRRAREVHRALQQKEREA